MSEEDTLRDDEATVATSNLKRISNVDIRPPSKHFNIPEETSRSTTDSAPENGPIPLYVALWVYHEFVSIVLSVFDFLILLYWNSLPCTLFPPPSPHAQIVRPCWWVPNDQNP